MKTYLSKLNPGERRFVVVVALVFFLVINIFWVWPHFSDWGAISRRLNSATQTLALFDEMFAKTNGLAIEVEKMQRGGGNVPAEDQAVAFLRTITTQAGKSGVFIGGNGRLITRTNQFFTEQIQTINVESEEKALVDFLYNLGSSDSLVRVRDLSVRPNPQHQKLVANITLIASYQKNVRVAPKAVGASAAKPASATTVPAPGVAPKPTPGTAAAGTNNSKTATPKKK